MSGKETEQKLRGGYYTPREITDFICDWAIISETDIVLEPSCGDGRFLESIIEKLHSKGCSMDKISENVHAVELYPKEAKKAVDNLLKLGVPNAQDIVKVSDFFLYYESEINKTQFDVVVGNPPFIRYQNFPVEYRERAIRNMKKLGLNPNRYTNTWVPFLVLSIDLLKPGGRIGMIIPAELFQVGYASETREFLSAHLDNLTIIMFKKLLFKSVQQEVVLVLGEKNQSLNPKIRIVEFENLYDLSNFTNSRINLNSLNLNEYKPLIKSDEKWTQYFLDTSEIKFLNKMKKNPHITWSNEYYDVDVGVVTGRNKFFILSKDEVEEKGLESEVIQIVTRSSHLKGLIFEKNDFIDNIESGYSSYLFRPSPIKGLSDSAVTYIKEGEKSNYHLGYKCRIRDPWYIVPTLWVPDAFMLRQVHDFPKLIANQTNATCTDTIHRVKFKKGTQLTIIPAFMNSLTYAFSEITGRSYGGGVLTFEPSEAERLPIPNKNHDILDIEKSDAILRTQGIDAVLDYHDNILLKKGLGMSDPEISVLRAIWQKLRDRRINRK